MRRRWMFLLPLIPLLILLFIFIGGEIVMHLWNWLLPPLFGWHEVTFWQALGLLILCRILFGGLGRHGRYGRSRRDRDRARAEIWERLTPEERERLRQGLRGRCGFGPATRESEGQAGPSPTPQE